MVSLTFYGGVDEIGGNKVLLEDGDVRVFLLFVIVVIELIIIVLKISWF
jgi:hypothetical protein